MRRPQVQDTGIGTIHGGPATISAGGSTFEVDEIVVAAGRTPASADLGLERVGVDGEPPHGYIDTDDHMAVIGGGDWLYAVGDVCGRALLTHMGKYQGRIAGDVIAARAEGRSLEGSRYRDVADHDVVPAVVFTEPQVASVGLTESVAREKGIDVRGARVRPRCGRRREPAARRLHRSGQARRRSGHRHARRRDVRRHRRRRVAALGDDRDRRQGDPRHAVARRAVLSDGQRGVAAAA